MNIDTSTNEVSKKNLAEYRLDIKDYWTPSEGESSDQLSGFYYIPNFISEQEEEYLIDKVCHRKPKVYSSSQSDASGFHRSSLHQSQNGDIYKIGGQYI